MSQFLTDRIKSLRGDGQRMAGRTFWPPVKKIVCKDGFHMSVQASETHYCEPRDSEGPWWSFEVGYPSVKVDEFMPYCDDPDRPTDTVYARVPSNIIEMVIEAHGGIAE